METQLLKDRDTFPDENVLKEALNKAYPAYDALMSAITADDSGLIHEWRYYSDGKAWLCKILYQKKTVFWLSVWGGFFKTSFYFTEKTRTGVMELDIMDNIKDDFKNVTSTGKLIPLLLNISDKKQLPDLLKIVQYKKSLK